MVKLFHRYLEDNSGNTAIEYCLIAVGISVAVIAVLNGLAALKLNAAFSLVNSDAWQVDGPPD